ncbi:type II toxin-antitoxin system HicB family antitoxin [Brevibacillus gelatini]|uniref:Type II toxin-antitoxin system HicB family antitoxin n=1 Tax=Brevibacillus gelatini TaxID=1655277 RepID=A0A3M8B7M4_9BACL|nr:type II toxin-antitoxin system HicB family antitoxin [Brevibacillus gelatini]RNB59370.1 type II toxin-antitoxin system HicB family antitoxin [Brevibacillus gelatini]
MYPAIFTYEERGVAVEFPDLPGCLTCGKDEEEAIKMAKEAMALHLYSMEKDNDPIPEPSNVKDINTEENEIVCLIEAWMPPFRDEMENRAVKKTLTIPQWLDDIATENNVNFSRILQEGLKKYLGVDEK